MFAKQMAHGFKRNGNCTSRTNPRHGRRGYDAKGPCQQFFPASRTRQRDQLSPRPNFCSNFSSSCLRTFHQNQEQIHRTIYPVCFSVQRISPRNRMLHENVIFTGGIKAGSSRMARRLRDRVEPRVFLSPTGFVPAIFLIESENSQRTLSRSSSGWNPIARA